MEQSQQPMRAIDESEIILPALEIARRGFGNSTVTRKSGLGIFAPTLTQGQIRFFQLGPCSHVIQHPTELGATCAYCFAKMIAEQEERPELQLLTFQEIEFECKPCRACEKRCELPGCRIPTCPQHADLGPDGKTYCEAHLLIVSQQHAYIESKERVGAPLAWVAKSSRSLFFFPAVQDGIPAIAKLPVPKIGRQIQTTRRAAR